MSILRAAAIGGVVSLCASITLRWAWEHVPYIGLGLCAGVFGAALSAAVAYILRPSQRAALSPFFQFLGLALYMLPKSDRDVWYLIQEDLSEDVRDMLAGGYSQASIRFIILWHTATELSGLLWNRAARLAPRQVFQWIGKFIGIVFPKFIGPAK